MFLPKLIQSGVRIDERLNILNMRKVFFLFVSSFFISITFDKQRRNRKTHNYNPDKINLY